MNCDQCGAAMAYIKGGVSKKPPHKAYEPFWSCPNCRHTVNIESNASQNQTASVLPPPAPIAREPVEVAQRALGVEFTEHNLNRRAALDKATQLAVAKESIGDKQTTADIVACAKAFYNFIEEIED